VPVNEPFRFHTRIRFIDTDTSGRIHYTAMFRYFESAEIEFMRRLGVSYTRFGYGFPRVHVECDFLLSIVHDDELEIEVFLTKLGRSSVRLEFRTLKEGKLAARGAVVIACMDKQTDRAIAIPAPLRERFERELTESPQEPQRSDLNRAE
jgi:YbgC/YbaW family acyl-CoA thioester hydrolase